MGPKDRILILAPHPDDEVLGCAGIVQKALNLKLPTKVVFLTNGDSNQWSFLVYRKFPVVMPKAVEKMGILRCEEALAAAQVLGLSPDHLVFLGYPDFGTLQIWHSRWHQRAPLRSILTRKKAVPYKSAYRPGAAHKGEEILQDLSTIIKDFRPTKIFVSHPVDYNGDHLALYLFTLVALWDLKQEDHIELNPYLIHYKGWPKLNDAHPQRLLEPPAPLKNQILWRSYRLDSSEIEKKQSALKAHISQFRSNTQYLLSFVRSNELFGDFPPVKLKMSDDANVFLHWEQNDHILTAPAELTKKERSSFVGLEWRFVQLEGASLVLSIHLSKPLAKDVQASVYIFGYRRDRSFGHMPKLHINLGIKKYAVYDQTYALSGEMIEVVHLPRKITIRVSLKALGNPERILAGARTYLGNVPLDLIPWRVLELV